MIARTPSLSASSADSCNSKKRQKTIKNRGKPTPRSRVWKFFRLSQNFTMSYGRANRSRVIAFLVASPFDLLDLLSLTTVFAHPKVDGKAAYLTKILSTSSEPTIRDASGFGSLHGVPFSEYGGPIDTLVVIGGNCPQCEISRDLIRWLQKESPRFRRIASVGLGTFLLASTGLLNTRRVTTHWRFAAALASQYPQLQIEKEPIFVKDGNIYSTAGATAGIDMALSFVEEDLGHPTAMSIAREMVLYLRRSASEAQLSPLLCQQGNVGGTALRDLPAWARARLTQVLDVHTLAKTVAMSPRTFARQFELHFRTTPARWIQSLRVEAARTHLETRELPLKAIASITGFRDEQALRRAFWQQLSMTPKEYRQRARSGPLASLADDSQGVRFSGVAGKGYQQASI
jgi:transcriptional regulator GlxA family with amidase domain